jgi:hypothetical protein
MSRSSPEISHAGDTVECAALSKSVARAVHFSRRTV